MDQSLKMDEYNYGMHQEILKDLLDQIERSPANFKSQQIDDPDITSEEKRKIAEKILFDNPVTFLNRFGRFLSAAHLKFLSTFKDTSNGYDVEFHINQLQSSLSDDQKRKIIKNRRFEALKRLEREGKYFGDKEMEEREPLLYHQLVGQYLSQKEKQLKTQSTNSGDSTPLLSTLLFRKAETDALDNLRILQEEAEKAEGASSDDERSDEVEEGVVTQRWGADWDDEEISKKVEKKRVRKRKISSDEKSLLLQEFRTHMYTKFLDGLDSEFDYSTVDYNPEYDCLQERSQDEEEKYFDEESCDNAACTDTGIEDY